MTSLLQVLPLAILARRYSASCQGCRIRSEPSPTRARGASARFMVGCSHVSFHLAAAVRVPAHHLRSGTGIRRWLRAVCQSRQARAHRSQEEPSPVASRVGRGDPRPGQAGFWKYHPQDYPRPFSDGALWAPEGSAAGERLRLVQHVPSPGAFVDLCKMMVKVSGIGLADNEGSLGR